MRCNRVTELRRERDRLTVDRDDHVVGFDAGAVGRLAGADGANEWVGAHAHGDTRRVSQ